MLKRVTGGLFQAAIGDTIQVFAVAGANNGVETVRFEYNHVRLGSTPITGHSGCQFVVVNGTKTFEAFVVFSSPPQGRYDLFQVNSAGGASPLGQSVTGADITSLIAFRVDGVAFAAVAAAPAPTRGIARGVAAPTPPVVAGARLAPKPERAVKKVKKPAKKTAAKKINKRVPKKKSRPARSGKHR